MVVQHNLTAMNANRMLGITAGALAKLGLDTSVTNADPTQNAVKIDGKDATIIYNGATITSSTNDISVNGLNITVNDVTTDETGKDTPIKLSVTNDVDAIFIGILLFLSLTVSGHCL